MQFGRNNLLLINTIDSALKSPNYLIYGNTVFECNGEDVIVNTIDFESTNIELIHPKITLKRGVRPIDIQRVFPESGRLISGSGNSFSGHIMLAASKPIGGLHDIWFLMFRRDELFRVVLFSIPWLEEFSM